MSRFARALGLAVVLSGVTAIQPLWAQNLDDASKMGDAGAADVNTAPDGLAGLKPLAKTDLSSFAGGTAVDSLNLATNTSTVTGNTIGNIGASGAIGSNSLSGTSGLTTFIANSGNQVVISQSTVVNVYLH